MAKEVRAEEGVGLLFFYSLIRSPTCVFLFSAGRKFLFILVLSF